MVQLIEYSLYAMAGLFVRRFGIAMQIEGAHFLRGGCYARTPERRTLAKRSRPKYADIPAATVTVQALAAAGSDGKRFYPGSLECGRWSVRAVLPGEGGREFRQGCLYL